MPVAKREEVSERQSVNQGLKRNTSEMRKRWLKKGNIKWCHSSAVKSLILIQGEKRENTCIERRFMADRQGVKKEVDVCEL